MYIIASTPYFEDVNIMGVIAAPNLTPIYKHPSTTPANLTEPKFLIEIYKYPFYKFSYYSKRQITKSSKCVIV